MKRFSNAGDKIQKLAVILALLGTLLIVFFHVALISDTDMNPVKTYYSKGATNSSILDFMYSQEDNINKLLIFNMIKDIMILWFWMLLLYAFGELCENVYELNHSSRVTFYDDYERFKKGQQGNTTLENALTGNPSLDSQKVWSCPSCGKQNQFSSQSCVNCGHSRT